MNSKSVLVSFLYKFTERIMVKVIGLVIGIILARLIAPDIYGLLAIITVFIGLAQTFVQSGLATALVQNQDTSEDDYSTVFYISIVIAALAVIILFFVAPLIARIYNSESIIKPLRVFSIVLLVGAYNSVQAAKLQREMRFKEMMICNLSATIIAGCVGVTAALKGYSLWALVIYEMTNQVVTTIAMFIIGKWFPRACFCIARAKILYSYGWKLLVSALLTSAYNEARTLIVGYKYSNADLAFYNKGYQFPNIIANTLDLSIQSVMLPVLSKEQEKKELLREILSKSIALSTFFVAPIMLGLAAIADSLIPLLLGDAWNDCIPLLRVFCLAEIATPLSSTNLSILKATGRTDLYMKTEFIRRIIMISVLIATIFCSGSVLLIAIGYTFSAWFDTYIIAHAVNKQIKCSWLQQAKVVWKSLLCGSIMYCVVYMMNNIAMDSIALIGLQILVGFAIYVILSMIIKNQALRYMVDKLKSMFLSKRYHT